MTPEEFWRSTLREIQIRQEGARWRQEQDARRATVQAHQIASYVRAKKLPSLRALLARIERAQQRARGQTRKEISSALLSWAAQTPGVKVEKWNPREGL